MLPLMDEEVEAAVFSSKPGSAPGPDGFSMPFFRQFWGVLKPLVFSICQGFCLGTVDLSRLNYAVLTLIPKVKGADNIRLFRPIALINNLFKFTPKAFATKFSPVAHRIISRSQSAFIKGRVILDGILTLHEIIHDLNARGTKAVIPKLDFEKAYDCVRWSFLQDVLLAKVFDQAYVHRIMQFVEGGHTAIDEGMY